MPDAIVAAAEAEEARAEAETARVESEAESAPVVVVAGDSEADQQRDTAIGAMAVNQERIGEWLSEQRNQLTILAQGQEAHMGVMQEIQSQLSALRATLESHDDDLQTLQEAVASSEPPSVLESVLPPPEETAPPPETAKHRRGRIVHGHGRRR